MIELRHVYKSFKNNPVLEDVNGMFEPGIVYCLTGRNGSGKSVLMKLICELLLPDQGEILLPEEHRFGIIIDNPRLWPDMTGKETLQYLASVRHEIDNDVINEYLKYMLLWKARNKKVGSYSLGMKQKLAIAQAFMEDPDILLLDEPSNALDDQAVQLLNQLIVSERDRGKYIILATHNIEDFQAITDQYVYIQDKQAVFG